MSLVPCAGMSDDGLVEMLNGNINMQLRNKDMMLTDATCYESRLRYPAGSAPPEA